MISLISKADKKDVRDFSKSFEFEEEEEDFNLGSLVDKSKKTISDSNINIIGENKMTEKNVC
jgi:hypothetical protein